MRLPVIDIAAWKRNHEDIATNMDVLDHQPTTPASAIDHIRQHYATYGAIKKVRGVLPYGFYIVPKSSPTIQAVNSGPPTLEELHRTRLIANIAK